MRIRIVLLLVLSSFLINACICTGVWGTTAYQIIELGSGWATGINNSGQIVGISQNPSGTTTGVLWQNGTPTSLGINPNGINDSGKVVGIEGTPSTYHASVWQNNSTTPLPSLSNTFGEAYAINTDGKIVGNCWWGSYYTACVWENGNVIGLQGLGGNYSRAEDINDTGQIVGTSTVSSGTYHASLWQNNTVEDLGPGYGFGVNNQGLIVGISFGLGGCYWQNGVPIGLSGLDAQYRNSTPFDINNSGQIVGYSSYSTMYETRTKACIWENGNVTELPSLPGWLGTEAVAINDSGQIVGYSYNSVTGGRQAILWQPVPEPSSILALLAGLAPFGAFMIKRRRA